MSLSPQATNHQVLYYINYFSQTIYVPRQSISGIWLKFNALYSLSKCAPRERERAQSKVYTRIDNAFSRDPEQLYYTANICLKLFARGVSLIRVFTRDIHLLTSSTNRHPGDCDDHQVQRCSSSSFAHKECGQNRQGSRIAPKRLKCTTWQARVCVCLFARPRASELRWYINGLLVALDRYAAWGELSPLDAQQSLHSRHQMGRKKKYMCVYISAHLLILVALQISPAVRGGIMFLMNFHSK